MLNLNQLDKRAADIETQAVAWKAEREALITQLAEVPSDDQIASRAAMLSAKIEALPQMRAEINRQRETAREREKREKLERDKRQLETLQKDLTAAQRNESRRRQVYFEASNRSRELEREIISLAESIARRDESFELGELRHVQATNETLQALLDMLAAICDLQGAAQGIKRKVPILGVVAAIKNLDPELLALLTRLEMSMAFDAAIRRAENNYRFALDGFITRAGKLKTSLVALHPQAPAGVGNANALLKALAGRVDQALVNRIAAEYNQ